MAAPSPPSGARSRSICPVCADCRVRAEEFRALWSALDDLPVLSPSAAFDASLRARIAAEPVRRGFWTWLPSPRLAFAVTALVAMSVWLSSMPQRGTMQPAGATSQQPAADADFGMIRDLPVLENYDVLSKFDALSELAGAPGGTDKDQESKKPRVMKLRFQFGARCALPS